MTLRMFVLYSVPWFIWILPLRAAKTKLLRGKEEMFLIGWHGNTDFFVVLCSRRGENRKNCGYPWHDDSLEAHTQTDIEQMHD